MISVTQQHIDSGLRGSCEKDPIALAMKDAGYTDVWVSPDRIRVPEDLAVLADRLHRGSGPS